MTETPNRRTSEMKKLTAAGVVLAGTIAIPIASYANIIHIDGFQTGGMEMWDSSGGYCIIAGTEGPSTAAATALTGGANFTSDTIYNASQTGWGYGVYGGYECANVHIYFPAR
jgi:hypothetical protein